jgi:hypothetical protein
MMVVCLPLIIWTTATLGFAWRPPASRGRQLTQAHPARLCDATSVAAALTQSAERLVDAGRVKMLQAAQLKAPKLPLPGVGERTQGWSRTNPDQHFSRCLWPLGTAFAIEGPLNTYTRVRAKLSAALVRRCRTRHY